MKPLIKYILLFIVIASTTQAAQRITGKVVGVSDGDTITILDTVKKSTTRIRLYGIDCPEKKQAFGMKAKKYATDIASGKTVEVTILDTDRYGRSVGIVQVKGNVAPLNELLIRNGYAWLYTRYCKDKVCEKWRDLEAAARRGKVGLWSDANPTPPWEFRRSARSGSVSSAKAKSRVSESVATNPALVGAVYHGNVKSKVFHAPGCQHYNCKNCTVTFRSQEEAVKAGYRPHHTCVSK